MNFNEIRQKYPEYQDMSDDDFAQRFHQKFYSDMAFEDFSKKVGYAAKQPEKGFFDNFDLKKGIEDTTNAVIGMGKDIIGANEAALNVGTGFTAGMLGGAIDAGQGIIDSIRGGTIGTPSGTKQAMNKSADTMERYTYAPKTERGQEIAKEVLDPVLEHMPSLVGAMPQFEALAKVRQAQRNLPRPEPLLEKFKKEEPTSKAAQEIAARRAQQSKMPTEQQELPLEAPNKFGQMPSEFTVDENGIPVRQEASLEAQTTARQGDLFEGLESDYSPPAREIGRDVGRVEKTSSFNPENGEATSLPPIKDVLDSALEKIKSGRGFELTAEEKIALRDIESSWNKPQLELPVERNVENRLARRIDETEQAWQQRKAEVEAEQRSLFDEAQRTEEIKQEPLQEPSQASQLIEKPQERTTYRPNSNQPLGQTGFGKGQRGSIGWKGKSEFEKFSDKLRKELPDVTEEEIKWAWEKEQQGKKADAIGKINPSFRDSLSAYKDVNKEDAVAAIQGSPDFEKTSLGGFRDTIMSRGRLGIEKIKNEGIKKAIAHMVGLRDAGKIRANEVLHGDNGILRNIRKMENLFSQGEAWEVFRQRFEAQFKPDYQYDLNPRQQKVLDQLNKLFDGIHSELERLSGKKIKNIPNYFPSMFYGDFLTEIRDADGRLVSLVTENSAAKVKKAAEKVLADMGEGFTASEPKYRRELKSNSFQGRTGLAQHFEAMIDLLNSDDPVVQHAQEAVQRAVSKRAMDTRQVKNRLKFKAGVEGYEGQKSWLDDRQNYYAAKDVLENYVRAFEDWKANMETAKFLKEVKETAGDKVNTYNVLQDYFDDIRANSNAVNRAVNKIDTAMANATIEGGFLTKPTARALRAIFNTPNARLVANTLTKLWLGWWNPMAMAQNVLQPVHSIAKLVDMAAQGGSKDIISPLIIGMGKTMIDGLAIAGDFANHKMLDKTGFGFDLQLSERARYLKDFEVIKPGLIEAKDKTKLGHVMEKYVTAGGQMTSEAFARIATFNIFSEYLQDRAWKDSGRTFSKSESYELAKNLTHEYMVNYEGYAKAGLINDFGVAGELAGRLQSFKINQFTQLANYIETAKQTKNPAPALTAIAMSVAMAGVSGMIGMDIAEGIYGILVNSGFVDPQTRSPRQWAMDLGGAAAFGVPTEVSGKWISGSLTTNLVGDMTWRSIAPIFAGTAQAIGELPTAGRWIKDAVTGSDTVPNSEKARALNTLIPTVVRGRVEDRLLTDPEGRITSPLTGEVVYQKGPQDENLLSKFTNIRSKERGETVARKAMLSQQEKRIQETIKTKVQNLEKLFDESVRMGRPLDDEHINKQFQDLLDLGNDPRQTIDTINNFIVKNHIGDWFEQQIAKGKINLSNVNRKLRAIDEKERINK